MMQTMTPINPVHPHPALDNSYFSPRSSPTPAKRLRSCLSPTRTPTGSNTPSRIHGSRAASFSSESDAGSTTDGWKRSKSVRWEGEDEGCAVTSYHATWSATEYDRTPLEPPSEAERTCVLPPRGSREIPSSYDCFDDSPHPSSDLAEDDDDLPSSPAEVISHESFVLATPDNTEEDCADVADREWEECMERRRMMFALRSRSDEHERQPEFEGYRSLSAKLADMLKSIEARREPSPVEEDEEDVSDTDEDQTDEEDQLRPCASFMFTNLQSLHIRPTPLDAIADADEQSTDSGLDPDSAVPPTPSLISSAESESEASIISPRSSMMNVAPRIEELPIKSLSLSMERTATVYDDEAV